MSSDNNKAIVKLNWKGGEPGTDPFSALSGDDGGALVSQATCSAQSDEDIDAALRQLVHRTALLARRLASGSDCALFLWDPVYATLTIVFTDTTLYKDGPLVTKCAFPLLDEAHSALSRQSEEEWEAETNRVSRRLKKTLTREVGRAKFPGKMTVFYSDQDRESFCPDEFQASQVSSEWQAM